MRADIALLTKFQSHVKSHKFETRYIRLQATKEKSPRQDLHTSARPLDYSLGPSSGSETSPSPLGETTGSSSSSMSMLAASGGA
jgi:hypothetical protein